MDKKRQAEISVSIGMAIFGAGLAGGTVVAYLKHEIPMREILIFTAMGLVFVVVGMVYGRIVDKVSCLFCDAIVPRFYASPDVAGSNFICAVCQRVQVKYPFGSSNIPKKKPCYICKRQFYPLPYLLATDGGKGPMACRGCIVVGLSINKALKEYAAAKGVDLTDDVAEEWARQ